MGALRALRLTPPPPLPQRSEHQSCVLKVLSCEFESNAGARESRRILDLGTSVSANVEFYSSIAAHIHIEDLTTNLLALGENATAAARSALLTESAPFRNDIGLDLIMCWDLFNYCSPQEVKLLGQRLASLSKPGTKLFTIVGTQQRIPAQPRIYRITKELRLVYESTTLETRTCPRFTKLDMTRFLPGFTRTRSFLLRNGMEEQLYVCKG